MNIKVAAFTVSEKSSNILQNNDAVEIKNNSTFKNALITRKKSYGGSVCRANRKTVQIVKPEIS